MEFQTRVHGIPVIVRVTDWEPYREAKLWGPPEDSYPAEGGYGEWELLNLRGQPVRWLEKKLTYAEREDLDLKVFEFMEQR